MRTQTTVIRVERYCGRKVFMHGARGFNCLMGNLLGDEVNPLSPIKIEVWRNGRVHESGTLSMVCCGDHTTYWHFGGLKCLEKSREPYGTLRPKYFEAGDVLRIGVSAQRYRSNVRSAWDLKLAYSSRYTWRMKNVEEMMRLGYIAICASFLKRFGHNTPAIEAGLATVGVVAHPLRAREDQWLERAVKRAMLKAFKPLMRQVRATPLPPYIVW